jgi:ketosteroid isomerase-like protein
VTSAADLEAVEEANRRFYEAIEHADLEQMAAVWVQGELAAVSAATHPGSSPVRGLQQVMRSWAVVLAGTSYVQYILSDTRVLVNGDVAVVTGYENILVGVEDEALGFTGGRVAVTNVFVRTDNGWRMLVHHASPVLEGADLEPGSL